MTLSVQHVLEAVDRELGPLEARGEGDALSFARAKQLRKVRSFLVTHGFPVTDEDRCWLSLIPLIFQEANYDDVDWSKRDASLGHLEGLFNIDFCVASGGLTRAEVDDAAFGRYHAAALRFIDRRLAKQSATEVPWTKAASPIVVGFWRRVVADLFDMLVLGAVGWALAYPFRYGLSELGARGVWGGLVINLLYAGVLQTRFGSGQTLGKRALGIQVLRLDGTFLGLGRSFGRYLIVSFVAYGGMYASIANLLAPRHEEAVDAVFSLAGVFALLACFLMIPLHPLKRGLHDLASGSIVVYKDRYQAAALRALENPARERRVFALLAALGILTFCAVLWGANAASKAPDVSRLSTLQQRLSPPYDVMTIRDFRINGARRTLLVVVWLPLGRYEDRAERERVRADVLARTRDSVPGIEDFERVTVRLESGFRMGIATWRARD